MRSAFRSFQQRQGLSVTGDLDFRTQQRLEQTFSVLASAAPFTQQHLPRLPPKSLPERTGAEPEKGFRKLGGSHSFLATRCRSVSAAIFL
jgi:peptidoglycan hydrolase-like protein with peptidoglycan-binding domain